MLYRSGRTTLAALFFLALSGAASAQPIEAASSAAKHWIGSWYSAPVWPEFPDSSTTRLRNRGVDNQTIREIAYLSLGGDSIRVRLSNAHGGRPLRVGAASVGLPTEQDASRLAPRSIHPLTFGGQGAVEIPPGAFVLSDPVGLTVSDNGRVSVSVFFPERTGALTWHYSKPTAIPSYISTAGDHTRDVALPVESTSAPGQFVYVVNGVEVEAPTGVGAIVVIGDSISDGGRSDGGAVNSWPSYLSRRLLTSGHRIAVVNAATAGGALLSDLVGDSGLARFDRDVIAQPGVRWVVASLGINDLIEPQWLNMPEHNVTSAQMIQGMRQLIARAHGAGLKIYGSTITPGIIPLGIPDQAFAQHLESVRQQVNAWIRTSGEYDAVIDFDRVVRDPSQPTRIIPSITEHGLSVHTNPEGARLMAESVDLSLFGDRP